MRRARRGGGKDKTGKKGRGDKDSLGLAVDSVREGRGGREEVSVRPSVRRGMQEKDKREENGVERRREKAH
jgi:hypothetical protein